MNKARAVREAGRKLDAGEAQAADRPAARQVAGGAELPVISLRGVRIHAVDRQLAIGHVFDELEAGRGGWIITVNLQHMHRCEKDATYRRLVKEAELVVADGMPLVWAASVQGTPLPERVAGSDLLPLMSEAAAERARSIFLIGGAPGAAAGAASALRAKHPELSIAGTHVPPYGFENDDEEVEKIRRVVVDGNADLVFVALGSPKQELLIYRLKNECPRAWWIGVGISFSFLAGQVHRAPPLLQRLGLEWVHRLLQEPRRLFRRYIIEGVPYGVKLMSSAAITRLRGPR